MVRLWGVSTRRWTLMVVGGLLAAGIVVAVVSIEGTGAGAGSALSLGNFAGYDWGGGSVREIEAAWTVPTIEPGSQLGRAGTWIGAEAPGSRDHRPFIQVGTNEERDSTGEAAGPGNFYYAFWSDTVRHFHPASILTVKPGDRVQARLVLRDARWTVSIVDAASRERVRFSTRDEGSAHFDVASWLEEDITNAQSNRPFPYPTTSRIRFTDLRVNERRPRPSMLLSSWMSLERSDLAPTALSHDAFQLQSTSLDPAAGRYLEDVNRLNRTIDQFYLAIATWTAVTARSQVESQASNIASAFGNFDRALTSTTWPASARPLIQILIRSQRDLIRRAREAPSILADKRHAWVEAWVAADTKSSAISHQIRQALHAPQLNAAFK